MEFLLFVAFTLGVIAVLMIILTESRTEVRPATAFVYNNIWTGRTLVALPGTEFIIPGIHRVLEGEISLRNEVENPDNVNLITGDGVELEVDFIVRRLQVGYLGMPKDGSADPVELGKAVIKAATAIKYSGRRDAILTRMVVKLQEEIELRTLNQLIPGTDPKTGETGKIDKKVMEEIETAVNNKLRGDLVTEEWGFLAEIDLEDYNLPKVIRQARERSSAAQIAGKAIDEKATLGKVNPNLVILADTLSEIFGGKKGDGK